MTYDVTNALVLMQTLLFNREVFDAMLRCVYL